jgi:hypothetical protein
MPIISLCCSAIPTLLIFRTHRRRKEEEEKKKMLLLSSRFPTERFSIDLAKVVFK